MKNFNRFTKLPFCVVVCCLLLAQIGVAQIVFNTPKEAAGALYAAWRTKNKPRAKAAADNKAINKLFGTNFIARRKFAGCTNEAETEKGLFSCVYQDPTDDLLNVAFEVVKKGAGWRVRAVSFAAEN